jgi:hypothetical protein
MVDGGDNSRMNVRKLALKALKAVLKGIIIYVVYLLVSMVLAPVETIVPGLAQMIEYGTVIYVILIVLGELTSGSLYHYFFKAATALFTICYLILTLQGGIFSMTFENLKLMIDLRFFLLIVIILGLVGLARSTFQAINYMNERAEPKLL